MPFKVPIGSIGYFRIALGAPLRSGFVITSIVLTAAKKFITKFST